MEQLITPETQLLLPEPEVMPLEEVEIEEFDDEPTVLVRVKVVSMFLMHDECFRFIEFRKGIVAQIPRRFLF